MIVGLGGQLVHVGTFRFTQQVGPVIVWQTGCLAVTTPLTRTGAGNYSIVLGADYALDDTEMIPFFSSCTLLAASGLTDWSVTSTNDTTKVLTTAKEAAMGGASVLADLGDVIVSLWKRPIR